MPDVVLTEKRGRVFLVVIGHARLALLDLDEEIAQKA